MRGGCARTALTVLVTCDIGPQAGAVQPVPTSGGDARPAQEERLPSRSVLVARGGDTVHGVLSEGRAVAHWPLAAVVGSRGGLAELGPTSGKGFCCRSHSKVHKMGGGHRIQTLRVAYVICSPTLTGQAIIRGTFGCDVHSGDGWGPHVRAALPFAEARSWALPLLFCSLSFWCSACLV